MSEPWQYQLRIDLDDEIAQVARRDPDSPVLGQLPDLLRRHAVTLQCQFDAFASYVADAERDGGEGYPLYRWTKATIEDPVKKAKYLRSFTLHVDGEAVYPKELADALEAELAPMVGGLITRLAKHDTNPSNNPQPPARYRD